MPIQMKILTIAIKKQSEFGVSLVFRLHFMGNLFSSFTLL